MRALLLADLCNPEWPSLPVVGYKYAKAIAEHVDTVVVTQVRNRANIEKVGLGRAEVVYLDTERIAAPLYKLAKLLRGGEKVSWTIQMAMDYPSYLAFERAAWRRFETELKAGQFDVVHRITPMSPTLPSYMAGRSPVPFVLGPLNGNLAWPEQFRAERSREREWLSQLRGAYKLLPYRSSTYSRSSAILAAFNHTIADLPKQILDKTINFPEVGIDPELFALPERPQRDRVTVLYAGRLVPYKLPEVVVRAFVDSPALQRHRLVVVGDGPERERLERIVREHHLEHCVELLGQRTQAEVGVLMREADILAFPSIRELGAGVVVEAMACGLACVVVDYGAPGTLIGPDWGVRVPLGTVDFLVNQFRTELQALVGDPDRIRRLGHAAHQHAMSFYAWDAKARKTLEVYRWLTQPGLPKPEFWSECANEDSALGQPALASE